MKAAIVILNYNGKDHLKRFLPDVVRCAPAYSEVIVADNASTDGSGEFMQQNFPGVRWIPLEKNYGFAEGYNRALKEVDAEYYALLNSDVEVTDGWLEGLIEEMDRRDDVAACQPKIRDLNKKERFEYAGAAGGFIDRNGFLFCRGRIFDHCETDSGQYDTPREVFWASGACLVVRSQIFHGLGGFDPEYFAHMEEVDLCWRIKNRGGRVFCFPASTVYHLGGGTLSSAHAMKTYLNFRNNLTLLIKNSEQSGLFGKIFLRMVLDGAGAFHLLFTRGFPHFLAVLKAHLHFYVFLPDIIEKRRKERSELSRMDAVAPNLTGLFRESIAMEYFRHKRRTFAELDANLFVDHAASPGGAESRPETGGNLAE